MKKTPLKRTTALRRRNDAIPAKHQAYYREHCEWKAPICSKPTRIHSRADDYLVGMTNFQIQKVWFWLATTEGEFHDAENRIIRVDRWAERIPLPNKYGARTQRVEVPGEGGEKVARSLNKLERDRGGYLELRQKAGEISELNYQRVWPLRCHLIPELVIPWRCDFDFVEDGKLVLEDTKGVENERFRLIVKLWPWFGSGELRIVKKSTGKRGGWLVRTIHPKIHE